MLVLLWEIQGQPLIPQYHSDLWILLLFKKQFRKHLTELIKLKWEPVYLRVWFAALDVNIPVGSPSLFGVVCFLVNVNLCLYAFVTLCNDEVQTLLRSLCFWHLLYVGRWPASWRLYTTVIALVLVWDLLGLLTFISILCWFEQLVTKFHLKEDCSEDNSSVCLFFVL